MTKFKEYLRAKGIKLECDYEYLPCNSIECVETEVMDSCVVAVVYSNCVGAAYAVFNRYGECEYYDSDDYHSHVGAPHCDAEYFDLLRSIGYIEDDWDLTVMRNVYEEHAKIRLAFKHMKAGLMDEKTFCKLALRYRFY